MPLDGAFAAGAVRLPLAGAFAVGAVLLLLATGDESKPLMTRVFSFAVAAAVGKDQKLGVLVVGNAVKAGNVAQELQKVS